jgi:hypothetical protein
MNTTTPATTPRICASPRATVAFSFLDSVHWLRTKLRILSTHTIQVPAQVHAAPLSLPHYQHR